VTRAPKVAMPAGSARPWSTVWQVNALVRRTFGSRRGLALDLGLALFFVVLDTGLTLVGASWWPRDPDALAWAMLVLQALACGSLVLRRRAPILVVGILAAFTLAVTLLIQPLGLIVPAHEGNVWAPFATVLAAYAPVMGCADRRKAFIAVAVLAVVVARPWQPVAVVITVGLLRTAVGPLLAMYFDARRRLVQALTERAERAEREQHLLAEQARAEERARLAGEMHDVVTHSVSLMVLQAGALRMTAPDEATRRAAEELRAAGSHALDELRDLVGILRTSPDAEAEPEESYPTTSGLQALVAEANAVGQPAELSEEGDPRLASPVVGRTTYRIVQEALTNARKHAPGARVTVRVRYQDAEVWVEVRNTAPTRPRDAALAGSGSGLGIASLRQRIELVGGSLRAGPAPAGAFRLEATMPAYVPTAESARSPSGAER
jgi:signal transduction histidine kinase